MTANHILSTNEDRASQIQGFISASGWGDAEIIALRADTSIRRYFRLLRNTGETAILMDAMPPMENTALFEFMDQKMDKLGFSVPEIYATNHELGLVIMEDFGDDSFFNLIQSGKEQPEKLLTLAVDALLHKYHADPSVALEGTIPYSDEYWLQRTSEFLDHYIPHTTGKQISGAARADYLRLFKDALGRAHRLPPVLLHGDYGLQNFIYLPDREGIKAVGLLDFQDTTDGRSNMCGSPVFDLAFLLRDVRENYPDALIDHLKNRFVEGAKITDLNVFEYEFSAIVAAQSAKCLGLFARFGYGNKRSEYLQFIPYCWRHLHAAFTHPDLADLKTWFETHTDMGRN